MVTAAGAAVLRNALLAVSAALTVAALGMWWLHRRRGTRAAAGTGAAGNCAGSGCGCGCGC
ncbi:hypothetical protein AB0M79_14215 [Polymorphospora sp. NPDC051019]|uniref:hypothetical protein n=1 Tax=Polymorphospora sp. NPDC051019 TaxID=3155725 RepID=UPI00343FF7F4